MSDSSHDFPSIKQGSHLSDIHKGYQSLKDVIHHGHASASFNEHLQDLQHRLVEDDHIHHQLEELYQKHVVSGLKQGLASKLGHFDDGILAPGHRKTRLNSHVKVGGEKIHVKDAAYEQLVHTALEMLKGHYEGHDNMGMVKELEQDIKKGGDDAEHARSLVLSMVDEAYHGGTNFATAGHVLKNIDSREAQQFFSRHPGKTIGDLYEIIRNSTENANENFVPNMINQVRGKMDDVYDRFDHRRKALIEELVDATPGVRIKDPHRVLLQNPSGHAAIHGQEYERSKKRHLEDLEDLGLEAEAGSYDSHAHAEHH